MIEYPGRDILSEGVVLLDFYKDECVPCYRLADILDVLSEKVPDVRFVKVNVGSNPYLAASFGVKVFPTVFILKDGVRRSSFGGWMPEAVIAEMITDVLNNFRLG